MKNRQRIDPRVVRTRQLIKDAFVKLLEENRMDKISVNRIAELATINRVTFYLHYKDIPDMLAKLADDMENDIRTILERDSTVNQFPISDADRFAMENLFQHIAKHAVVGLTKNVGYQYAKLGIRCNAIAPGGVETNIGADLANVDPPSLGLQQAMVGMGVNPRTGKPEEFARVTVPGIR